MEDITKQALDMVFNNQDLKTKVKKGATPYVAGVAVVHLLILVSILYIIFQIRSLRKVLTSVAPT